MEELLAAEGEAAVGRRIVDGYERIPPETPDESGELAAMTDSAAVDLLSGWTPRNARKATGLAERGLFLEVEAVA